MDGPLFAWVDGSRPPSSTSLLGGVGVALHDHEGELLAISRPASPSLCIDYLEHLAILVALEAGEQIGALWITIHCDASHVIAQLTQVVPPAPGMGEINRRVRLVMRRFCSVSLVLIGREENTRAHELARIATHYAWTVVSCRDQKKDASRSCGHDSYRRRRTEEAKR